MLWAQLSQHVIEWDEWGVAVGHHHHYWKCCDVQLHKLFHLWWVILLVMGQIQLWDFHPSDLGIVRCNILVGEWGEGDLHCLLRHGDWTPIAGVE